MELFIHFALEYWSDILQKWGRLSPYIYISNMKIYYFIMRWNSSFISFSNNEDIFFQYDVESLHIYGTAVHACFLHYTNDCSLIWCLIWYPRLITVLQWNLKTTFFYIITSISYYPWLLSHLDLYLCYILDKVLSFKEMAYSWFYYKRQGSHGRLSEEILCFRQSKQLVAAVWQPVNS